MATARQFRSRMFFWTPDTIRHRPSSSSSFKNHQNGIIIFTALAAILFLIVAIYGVLSSTTNGQIGRGLRKVNFY